MVTLFGIKNCDSVKKARRWLDEHQIDYHFHDFRVDGLTQQQVKDWLSDLGAETLVNKRSTTWKALDENSKQAINTDAVVNVILESPTLIKRPLLDTGTQRLVGFKPDIYTQSVLSAK